MVCYNSVIPSAPLKTILVVDDEAAIRRLFRILLERAGYRVAEAANGREALRVIDSEPIDLMITDIVMPDQEGLETLTALRAGGRPLKIIAISGAAFSCLKIAKILGANATLPKPVTPDDLLATVERVLNP